MPGRTATSITLTPEHSQALEALIRVHSTPQKLAERGNVRGKLA